MPPPDICNYRALRVDAQGSLLPGGVMTPPYIFVVDTVRKKK